jgi:UDP-N-acetylmuramoyl-L-alanyl-D-glutamate--2,6-diaminopimelate ligase
MERIDAGQPFTVLVDYAHTPEALRSVLNEARRLAQGRVLTLFGSAGERDIAKRAIQGAVAQELADFAIFTSEDPRFEDPDAIIAAIVAGAEQAGGRRGVDFECIEERRAAVFELMRRALPGDVVVLAGKGHERSLIYGDTQRAWDEAAVAREALQASLHGAGR